MLFGNGFSKQEKELISKTRWKFIYFLDDLDAMSFKWAASGSIPYILEKKEEWDKFVNAKFKTITDRCLDEKLKNITERQWEGMIYTFKFFVKYCEYLKENKTDIRVRDYLMEMDSLCSNAEKCIDILEYKYEKAHKGSKIIVDIPLYKDYEHPFEEFELVPKTFKYYDLPITQTFLSRTKGLNKNLRIRERVSLNETHPTDDIAVESVIEWCDELRPFSMRRFANMIDNNEQLDEQWKNHYEELELMKYYYDVAEPTLLATKGRDIWVTWKYDILTIKEFAAIVAMFEYQRCYLKENTVYTAVNGSYFNSMNTALKVLEKMSYEIIG